MIRRKVKSEGLNHSFRVIDWKEGGKNTAMTGSDLLILFER